MAKLGNIRKVIFGGKTHYVDRVTGQRVSTREANRIIGIQRAQGKMSSPKVQKAIETITNKTMEKDKNISYKEARQRAKDRIETSLVDAEFHEDEPDYEPIEWSP